VPYNIADLFEHTADVVPDRLALIDRDTRLTYAQLDARANRFGHYLVAQGVQPADHVGIYAMNSEAWVTAMLGCLKARAVPINVNYRYVEDELSYLIGTARALRQPSMAVTQASEFMA
jgi:acyl-CoA synthetase (AMP-forming)/AMP-acid ligase II